MMKIQGWDCSVKAGFRRGKLALGILVAAGLLFTTFTLVIGTIYLRAVRQMPSVVHLAEDYEQTGIAASDLPQVWLHALVAVEDPAFFSHPGVDFRSPGAGWTTITQGLVKLHYEGPMQGLFGKPRQSIIALALNRTLDKRSQLTLFLNTAYLGQINGGQIRGFSQAADHYYGHNFRELTFDQFLGLVATLLAPNRLDPIHSPAANLERVQRIQALLASRCAPLGWRDVYLNGCDLR
jgi:membrane peptidoglycan carboxypeptidase